MWKTMNTYSPLRKLLLLQTLLSSNPRLPTQSLSASSYSLHFNTLPSLSPSTQTCNFLDNLRFPSGKVKTFLFFSSQVEAATADKPNLKCWNCQSLAAPSSLPFLVCQSCRSVQPVHPSVDYFDIFGLDKKYEIGDVNLEGMYKEWQKKLHPDLVHTKSEREREYAAEQSACVIDAYRTLRSPLSRAIYVLKLRGVNVDEEETVSEAELLSEIMEIREAVEEATDSQALNQIRAQMEDKLRNWTKSFADAINNQNIEEALRCIRRMKYYSRVNEEIVKKL